MLTEERHRLILEKLNLESVVYVNDLVNYLNTSESTIRRDLNSLHKEGKLKKVHGGATTVKESSINTKEEIVELRQTQNFEEKVSLAKFAASTIEPDDFVYIDAGTTTELMIDFITEKNATFITNGIVHARKLIYNGCKTYIIGGELKLVTEAIVGVEAIRNLQKYNFTKGFFGTNGVDKLRGFTTPDLQEAMVKEEALSRCKKPYILCDSSKFEQISSIVFGEINKAIIITTKLQDKSYKNLTKIMEVDVK